MNKASFLSAEPYATITMLVKFNIYPRNKKWDLKIKILFVII